jgi:hypothetical protein
MLKDRFKLAYFNGCSFTQGGGLETENDVDWNERDSEGNEPSLIDGRRGILKEYKETYGIPYWKTRLDVAYPAVFASLSEIETINDAKSGGGIARLIRKTFNFVIENWEKRNDLLLFLEIPDYSRLEFYSNTYKDYLLFNYTINQNGEVDDWFVCRDYANRSHSDENNQLRNGFNYLKNEILNPKDIFTSLNRDLLNLLSFLKLNGVEFYITKDIDYGLLGLKESLFSDHLVPFGSPHQYAVNNRGQISDEVKIDDTHPGLLCHREYAKQIFNYLSANHR